MLAVVARALALLSPSPLRALALGHLLLRPELLEDAADARSGGPRLRWGEVLVVWIFRLGLRVVQLAVDSHVFLVVLLLVAGQEVHVLDQQLPELWRGRELAAANLGRQPIGVDGLSILELVVDAPEAKQRGEVIAGSTGEAESAAVWVLLAKFGLKLVVRAVPPDVRLLPKARP